MANPLSQRVRLLVMPILRKSLQPSFSYLNLTKSKPKPKLPRCSSRCCFSCFAFQKGQKPSILNEYSRHVSQTSEKKDTKSKSQRIQDWSALLLCFVLGGGFIWSVRTVKDRKEKAKEKERLETLANAHVGGPFELTDHDGNPKSDKDFLGQWILLYFGFTHCPDVCHDQLEKMNEVLNIVDKQTGIEIKPLFISVDPDRDDAKTIKEYLKDFHPRMLGLTGTEEQTKNVTKVYHVYSKPGPKDEDDDYIIDHTTIWYLMNPQGKFAEYFLGLDKSIEEISDTVIERMK